MPTIKDRFFNAAYQKIFKPVFFRQDPESIHDRMTKVGAWAGRHTWTRLLTKKLLAYQNPKLKQTILGIHFSNPVGLSAGFDKEGVLTDILPSVGFGFAEIGSITGTPSPGNPKPRLWRLPLSRALIVHYGLNSSGAKNIAAKLREKNFEIPIITSVAKANLKETCTDEAGVKDYELAIKEMAEIGDLTTINISCPNAYGGQPFNDAKRLEQLLEKIDAIPSKKPVLVKLPPDLTFTQIDELLEVCSKHRVDGLVCTNLTKDRANDRIRSRIVESDLPGPGGISGKVIQDLSDEVLSYIYRKAGNKFVLVGVGGIFSAEDAYKKIKLGASLVQLITGMIYNGPQLIGQINRGLVELLEKDGFQSIADAIGSDQRPLKSKSLGARSTRGTDT